MNNSYLYEYFRKDKNREEVYVVKEGDTLYNIANTLKINLDELIKSNNLQNSWIFPNQVLIIPREQNSDGIYFEEYKIKFNDTLAKISEDFNITLDEIIKYNDLGKLKLLGDQELQIPKNYKTYQIVATDTLDYILNKTGMTAYELLEANFDTLLKVGTVIKIK